jgi:hypothetical protein
VSALVQMLVGFLSGGVGQRIGSGVANLTAAAALAPLGLWLLEHREEAFVTLSYGELALFGLLVFAIVKVIHYTRAPGPAERAPWHRGPGE